MLHPTLITSISVFVTTCTIRKYDVRRCVFCSMYLNQVLITAGHQSMENFIVSKFEHIYDSSQHKV